MPVRCSGRFRECSGMASSRDEVDHKHRLLQALNCLLVETQSGRVLIETGIGERLAEKTREIRAYEGPRIVPAIGGGRASHPKSGRRVAMSHLHFDHAGGLLRRRRRAGVPAREDRRPAGRMGSRARRQPAPRRLVRPARAPARREMGQRGRSTRHESSPASPSSRPAAIRAATRRSSCAAVTRTVGFIGDLFMRPGTRTRGGWRRSTTSRSRASR